MSTNTPTKANEARTRDMLPSPCDAFPPGDHRGDICRGTFGTSPHKRRLFIKRWLANGTIASDPDGYLDNAESTPPVHAAKASVPQKPSIQVIQRTLPCQSLGPQLRTAICKQCGRKGSPAPIFACAKHGECTLRSYKVGVQACCLTCTEYAPASLQTATWAVGVTTAPRSTPTLSETVLSVQDAGWQPVVYAEPESPIPDGVPVVQRFEKQGAWKNWLQTAHQLVNADMSHVLIMQDDVLICRDAKELVESEIDDPSVGVCTLYTSAKYHKERTQVHDIEAINFWGACALAFRTSVLRQVLASKIVTEWSGDAGIDNAVGKAVNALGLKIRGWSPSLAQHIGNTSSLWSTKDATGNRAAKEWRGDPTPKLP